MNIAEREAGGVSAIKAFLGSLDANYGRGGLWGLLGWSFVVLGVLPVGCGLCGCCAPLLYMQD